MKITIPLKVSSKEKLKQMMETENELLNDIDESLNDSIEEMRDDRYK